MPTCSGKGYLIQFRDDFAGWLEARAVSSVSSAVMAKFFFEDVITRHDCFGKLVCNCGSENKKYTKDLAKSGIPRIVVPVYNLMAEGIFERGHQTTNHSLPKLTNGGYGNWVQNLYVVIWADRTTV